MKNVLIPMTIFNEKYGVSRFNTSMFKKKNTIPGVFTGTKKNCMVNETYFVRRKALFNRVKRENEDNYYFLTEFLSCSSIARLFVAMGSNSSENSYTTFLNRGLLTFRETSILHTVIPSQKWEFWRLSNRLIKIIKKLKDKSEHSILLYIKEHNCGTILQAGTPILGDTIGGYNENYNKTKNK